MSYNFDINFEIIFYTINYTYTNYTAILIYDKAGNVLFSNDWFHNLL